MKTYGLSRKLKMKTTYRVIKQLRITPEPVDKFNARLIKADIYGELSQPQISNDPQTIERYTTIDLQRAAVQILNVEFVNENELSIDYRLCGELSSYVKEHTLALRGLVINDIIRNIITFDIIQI